MKQILKVLGTSFIMTVVILSLLIVLNNIHITSDGKTYKGIFEVIGMASDIEGLQNASSDSTVFESVVASEKPEIYFDKKELENIIKEENIEILKYFIVKFKSEDSEINAENVDDNCLKILDIIDSKGRSVIYLYDKHLKTINFENSDIYTFSFYLINDEQRESIAKINIPVN